MSRLWSQRLVKQWRRNTAKAHSDSRFLATVNGAPGLRQMGIQMLVD
jgi:hypothetical protein